jgi:vancomycin permeability regulator SanA
MDTSVHTLFVHALIFAYHQLENGEIDAQTKSRCDKAVELYRAGKIHRIYLTAHVSRGGKAIADEMRDYLRACGIPPARISTFRLAGNTAGELDVFRGFVPMGAHIALISSGYHTRRIAWLAKHRFPVGKTTIYAAEDVDIKLIGDRLMEIHKTLLALLMPIKWSKTVRVPPALEY